MSALVLTGPGLTPDTVADISEKFEEGEVRVKPGAVRISGLSPMAERALARRFFTMPDIDLLTIPEPLSIRDFKLLAIDMDSTLIQNECIDDMAAACGRGEEVAAVTRAAMEGKLSFDESLKNRCEALAGADAAIVGDALKAVRLTRGALRFIDFCHRFGLKTYILSGGFTGITKPVAKRLGMTGAYSNELDIRDGKLTGRVTGPEGGPIQNADGKAKRLEALAQAAGVTPSAAIAVGDGANDLAMIRLAGVGVAFHAKPLVRQSARYGIDFAGLDAVTLLFDEAWD